jgi:hypothetical protein
MHERMERARPLAGDVEVDLSVSEVLRYFKNPVQPSYPPIKPKAGEIYLITWNDDSCSSEYT